LIHIPIIPVLINGQPTKELSAENLRSEFSGQVTSLLIYGEGGIGKTSLACRIARWAVNPDPLKRLTSHSMLPVLIEEDLDSKVAEGKRFKEAIRRQLKLLVDEKDIISDELLTRLLLERRILVVVDRFSELSKSTQLEIKTSVSDIPVNAVILTARNRHGLEDIIKTYIKPSPLNAELLPSFIGSYLDKRQKRCFYPDTTEFLQACVQLSGMDKRREVTVLLAKLYAEQMISAKEKEQKSKLRLPNTIPDLMLNYLNELNQGKKNKGGKFSNHDVRRDAKIVAWECLKQTLQPSLARLNNVIPIIGGENAEARLEHLAQNSLGILQQIPPEDQVRFTLDPLAEYLAALHLLEINNSNAQAWKEIITRIEALSTPNMLIQGFLLALRDCCLLQGEEHGIPNFVLEYLEKLQK
jgi:hypothetical protein